VPSFLGRIGRALHLLHVVVLMLPARPAPDLAHRPVGERIAVGLAVPALNLAGTSYRLVERPAQRLGRAAAVRFSGHRACRAAHGPGRERRRERLGSIHGQEERTGGRRPGMRGRRMSRVVA